MTSSCCYMYINATLEVNNLDKSLPKVQGPDWDSDLLLYQNGKPNNWDLNHNKLRSRPTFPTKLALVNIREFRSLHLSTES